MIPYQTKTTSLMWWKGLAQSLTISYPLNNHGNEIYGNVAVSKHAQVHEDMELEPRRCADVRKSNGQLLTVMTYMSSMSISWLWYLYAFSGFSDLSYMSIIHNTQIHYIPSLNNLFLSMSAFCKSLLLWQMHPNKCDRAWINLLLLHLSN
jgi:hypothetical protein